MFDSLSSRLEGIVKRLRGKGRLSEADVDEVLKEIRTALLEADVNVGVVRNVDAARGAGALGAKLSGGGRGGNIIALVTPAQAAAVDTALRAAGAAHVIVTTVAAASDASPAGTDSHQAIERI